MLRPIYQNPSLRAIVLPVMKPMLPPTLTDTEVLVDADMKA
jgi:hypothetical protein